MILYVNGQDIARLVLGVIGEKETVRMDTGPDQFLSCLGDFLQKRHATLDDVKGVVCVRGPGSATALRVSLSMVQALAFAQNIRTIGIEKDPDTPDQETFQNLTEKWFLEHAQTDAIVPLYLHAPQITAPARDHLKRPF